MIKIIGIGFLGLGTVGSKVLGFIQENQMVAGEKVDIKFEVHSIYVRDLIKKRDVDVSGINMTSHYEEVISNPNIQICIECMGGAGTDKTYEIISAAMKNGKHVIMSSKKCLALYMNQIIEAANYYNIQLRFEATVGGAIPICRTLMNMSRNDQINKMYGIVNATTNYVLSSMEQSNTEFEQALRIAKEKGLAENDSSEDITGWDATYKMSILARVGMHLDIGCEKLTPVSTNIMAGRKVSKDTSIRQAFYLERHEDNKVSYYVGPVEVQKNSILGNVKDNFNIIFTDSSSSGLRAYYGRGAGGEETAAAMYEDLLDIVKRCYWFEPAKKVECRKIEINETMMTE